MKNSRFNLSVAAMAIFVVAPTALADPKPEDAVHYREGIMMAMAWNFGPMGAMVKGDIAFDAGQFAFHAGRLAVLAPMALEGFPPSSASAKSEAKPALWENLDDFKKRMQDLENATMKLAEVAKGGDEAAMKAEFGTAAKVCKGCHDEYQKEH
jgi:cytochrome c556